MYGRCARVFSEEREGLASCDCFFGAQEVFCYLRHNLLTPPADARFNGSVRLVYRRKNVIGIVLTEAGKVYQEPVFIGHGEGDL